MLGALFGDGGSSATTPLKLRTGNTCDELSPRFASALAAGVKAGDVRALFAVRSPDHQNAWYVAGHVDGPTLRAGDSIALWATTIPPFSTDPSGTIVAVNSVARLSSQWGAALGGTTFTESDAAARDAMSCVRERMDTR